MDSPASMFTRSASAAIAVTTVASPLGVLLIAAAEGGICMVTFDDRVESLEPRLRRRFGHFFHLEAGDPFAVERRLRRYFDGRLRALEGAPLGLHGTPMQSRVWDMLRALGPGELTTYAALAERLGMPRAQRAVGVCLASNPVPLFVPCHRVVAASGGLGSHPGGIPRKRWLLDHEGALDAQDARAARSVRRRLLPRERSLVESADFDAVPL
ncbi:MAG: methylated-DNA--[protein]-cysteine S-methyltransferase [Casimicrobiaceae bacterium]